MSTLQLASDTLAGTPTAGQVEYNGQFYATDSNASRGQLERLVQGTAVASTSGTSITFTGIPAWAKRITVMFNGVSISTSVPHILVQIGSGSVSTSGYNSDGVVAGSSGNSVLSTSGFVIWVNNSAQILYGSMVINLFTGTTYISNHTMGRTDTSGSGQFGGGVSPSLSGALDRVVITTTNGTDTFDAGSINIMYEG